MSKKSAAIPAAPVAGLSSAKDRFFEAVRTISKDHGCPVWCVVHVPPAGHICGESVYSLYSERDSIGTGKKVEIILNSPGGNPQFAFNVMQFFRQRFEEVNIIVPLYAKSAGTLMCLGADRVYMGEMAELGPIDIQITDPIEHGMKNVSPLDEFKSIEFLREQAIEWMHYYAVVMHRRYGFGLKEALKDSVPLVTQLLSPMFEQLDPLEMGEHRRALAIGEEYAHRMLKLSGNENAAEVVRRLVWTYPSHEFSIGFHEADEIGLPVHLMSKEHDRLLSDAIMRLGKDDSYHGFAPAPPSPQQATATPVSPVRRRRTRKNAVAVRRAVNGSGGISPQQPARA